MRRLFWGILVLLPALTSDGQTTTDTTNAGLPYKIFSKNSGRRVRIGDIITANFVQKTENGRELINTFRSGKPLKIQVRPSGEVTDLMDFYLLLSEKDSAFVMVPLDSIFKNFEEERPKDLGNWVLLTVKIENVQTEEELITEILLEIDRKQKKERELLAQYQSENKLTFSYSASGLGYTIIRESVKDKPAIGDTVFIDYAVRTLTNDLIDTSWEQEARQAGVVHPRRIYKPISFVLGKGEVIKGVDEGLLLMHEGSTVRFIVPSRLAYGWEGFGEYVEPFTTLIIDMELVKIKRSQKRR